MAAQFYQNVWAAAFSLTPAHTTVLQTITTLTAFTKIDSIQVCSTDTNNKDIQLVATIGGSDYQLINAAVPLRSGDLTSAPAIALLRHANFDLNQDIVNNKVLCLPSGTVLKIKAGSTLTAAKTIGIILTGETFT